MEIALAPSQKWFSWIDILGQALTLCSLPRSLSVLSTQTVPARNSAAGPMREAGGLAAVVQLAAHTASQTPYRRHIHV